MFVKVCGHAHSSYMVSESRQGAARCISARAEPQVHIVSAFHCTR